MDRKYMDIYFDSDHIRETISLLEWYLLARQIVGCPNCGTWLTSLNLCPNCGKRWELTEIQAAQLERAADGADSGRKNQYHSADGGGWLPRR